MQKLLSILLLLVLPLITFGTHNRAGEISFKYLGGLTYEITLVTYTYTASPADRPELAIKWGDSSPQDTILRINEIFFPNNVKKNIYIAQHTYPGPNPSPYIISLEDPNRNANILNIPNSVNIVFYIETELYINPFIGANNSPVLLNPPIDNACVGYPYIHNPGAWDPDGDSLYYSLQKCKREGGQQIIGYTYPQASNSLTINSNTGELKWDSPLLAGEYNVAILVEEFRQGVKVGSVLRDMQITVAPCNHTPPEINGPSDTCVIAGDTIAFSITATDNDIPNQTIQLSESGGPFLVTSSPATFQSTLPGSTVTGNFYWETNCNHIKKYAYQAFFKAQDNGNPNLVDFHTTNIQVIGPSPKNVTAITQPSSILLKWSPSECSQVKSYKIYRKKGASGWSPAYCETGIPSYVGYTLIGVTTGLTDTIYNDDNNGLGLIPGEDYCYRIVAVYPDGAESKASAEVCQQLKKNIPIITHTTVTNTSPSIGSLYVQWSKPTEHDTILYPGPYKFLIYRSDNSINNFQLIDSLPTINDTSYTDTLINTADNQYYYRIDMYNLTNGVRDFMGKSVSASSVYLKITPSDNKLTLNWNENVPWTNSNYTIYKYNNTTLTFDSIGTTTTSPYIDSNLVNGVSYCYLIKSKGNYTASGIVNPLYNFSQEVCEQPIDNEAPCPPVLTVDASCENLTNFISWTNPNNYCADDVLQYNLYKKDSISGDYILIITLNSPTDTSFLHDNLSSIAGCYVVTAIDSVGNESVYSDSVCVNNCPDFQLPNIFTPGDDGLNDLFVPFSQKFVDNVHIEIFNRWGQLVFESDDPKIGWDGTNTDGKECVDGVYFYVCKVTEIYLDGKKPKVLKGFVQLIRNK